MGPPTAPQPWWQNGNGPDIVELLLFYFVSNLPFGAVKADSSTVERLYSTQRRLYGSIPAPPTRTQPAVRQQRPAYAIMRATPLQRAPALADGSSRSRGTRC